MLVFYHGLTKNVYLWNLLEAFFQIIFLGPIWAEFGKIQLVTIFNSHSTPIFCQSYRLCFLLQGNDHQYLLRVTPTLFEPKPVHCALCPDTFTAQEARIYFKAESTNFRNRAWFTKHANTILKLLVKARSFTSKSKIIW